MVGKLVLVDSLVQWVNDFKNVSGLCCTGGLRNSDAPLPDLSALATVSHGRTMTKTNS